MASAGTVTLELDANSVKLIRELQKAQKQTKKSGDGMSKSMTESLKKIRQGVNTTIKALGAMSVAAAVGAAAIFRASSQNIREMQNQARAANTTTSEFQRQAFAARTVGIEQGKYADILKDVNDRVGDFLTTGGGPMADFFERIAPKVGVTAEQFRRLSGPQALQLYVDSLQKANVSQAEMTFFMEAMASDSTRLIPLLRNGGTEMARMAGEAERLGIGLSEFDVAQVEAANAQIDNFGLAMQGVAQRFTVELAPVVEAVGNMLLESTSEMSNFAESSLEGTRSIAVAFAFVGDAVERFGLTIKSLRVTNAAMFTSILVGARAVMVGIENVINGTINGLNDLIFQMNKIPGVNIDFIGLATFRSIDELDDMIATSRATLESFRSEWQAMADAPLNTEKVNAFFDNIIARMDEARSKQFNPVVIDGDSGVTLPSQNQKDIDKMISGVSSIVGGTLTQVERLENDIQLVRDAVDAGITQPFIEAGTTSDEVLKRLQENLKELEEPLKESAINMEEFSKAAAQNMQSAFADFLFDPFDEGLKGMLRGFLDVLRRMVAELLAQKILMSILGGFSGSPAAGAPTDIGGVMSTIFGGVRDSGGMGEAGKAYMINPVAGPELFIPQTAGHFIPNADEMMGGGKVQVNVQNYGGENVDVRTRKQGSGLNALEVIDIVVGDIRNRGKTHKAVTDYTTANNRMGR